VEQRPTPDAAVIRPTGADGSNPGSNPPRAAGDAANDRRWQRIRGPGHPGLCRRAAPDPARS